MEIVRRPPALFRSPPLRLLRGHVAFRVGRRFQFRSGLWTLGTASCVRLGRRGWSRLRGTWKLPRSEKLWVRGGVARLAVVVGCWLTVRADERSPAAAMRVCFWAVALWSRSSRGLRFLGCGMRELDGTSFADGTSDLLDKPRPLKDARVHVARFNAKRDLRRRQTSSPNRLRRRSHSRSEKRWRQAQRDR